MISVVVLGRWMWLVVEWMFDQLLVLLLQRQREARTNPTTLGMISKHL
jgi:hypothetical protein